MVGETGLAALIMLPAPEAGRGDRIRTCDPLLPKQMRYQAALLPDGPARLEALTAAHKRCGR